MAAPGLLYLLDLAYLLLSELCFFRCSFFAHASEASQWWLGEDWRIGLGGLRYLGVLLGILGDVTVDLVSVDVEQVFLFTVEQLVHLGRVRRVCSIEHGVPPRIMSRVEAGFLRCHIACHSWLTSASLGSRLGVTSCSRAWDPSVADCKLLLLSWRRHAKPSEFPRSSLGLLFLQCNSSIGFNSQILLCSIR